MAWFRHRQYAKEENIARSENGDYTKHIYK